MPQLSSGASVATKPLQPAVVPARPTLGSISSSVSSTARSGGATSKPLKTATIGQAGDIELVALGRPRGGTTLVKREVFDELKPAIDSKPLFLAPTSRIQPPSMTATPTVTTTTTTTQSNYASADSIGEEEEYEEILSSSSTMPLAIQQPVLLPQQPQQQQQQQPPPPPPPPAQLLSSSNVPTSLAAMKRKQVDSKLFISKKRK
jgi:hypothetical protein